MTGGWIHGNLYGGSELSNDGPENPTEEEQTNNLEGLVFVNLVGGTISGRVFGGGYKGTVDGSTHLHIGTEALEKCNYYTSDKHKEEKPAFLVPSKLVVEGSVYAGGDYGGGESGYDTITVKGFSHVYIDGTGYRFTQSGAGPEMEIKGGVFGSGASCDAGDIRLVTLDNYGAPSRLNDDGMAEDVTRTLTSIQRADQVRLIKSHVRLTGASDVANDNQTALYSLNRIGDKNYEAGENAGKLDKLGKLGNSLALEGGSTVILDSTTTEVANFKSVDDGEEEIPFTGQALAVPNAIILETGTVFRISYKNGSVEEYGAVSGYSYIVAGDQAEAYAYARQKNGAGARDGGFVVYDDSVQDQIKREELEYHDVAGTGYRYWQIKGKDVDGLGVTRQTVLTARKLETEPADGYAVAEGAIELPPAASGSIYVIKEINISSALSLVDAAKLTEDGEWLSSGEGVNVDDEKQKIQSLPLSTFGLILHPDSGFGESNQEKDRIVSNHTSNSGSSNSIIGDAIQVSEHVTDGSIPQIRYYLTYKNDEIKISQDLGTVDIVLQRKEGDVDKETITMNVQILTRASELSPQTVDLYATQKGSYTGS